MMMMNSAGKCMEEKRDHVHIPRAFHWLWVWLCLWLSSHPFGLLTSATVVSGASGTPDSAASEALFGGPGGERLAGGVFIARGVDKATGARLGDFLRGLGGLPSVSLVAELPRLGMQVWSLSAGEAAAASKSGNSSGAYGRENSKEQETVDLERLAAEFNAMEAARSGKAELDSVSSETSTDPPSKAPVEKTETRTVALEWDAPVRLAAIDQSPVPWGLAHLVNPQAATIPTTPGTGIPWRGWNVQATGEGVSVYLLDTPVQRDHQVWICDFLVVPWTFLD